MTNTPEAGVGLKTVEQRTPDSHTKSGGNGASPINPHASPTLVFKHDANAPIGLEHVDAGAIKRTRLLIPSVARAVRRGMQNLTDRLEGVL